MRHCPKSDRFEEIVQPRQRRTIEEHLGLLDTHALFTGRYPRYQRPIPYSPSLVHYDCIKAREVNIVW
ncbi:MAG TPA: hypothetical protein DEV81_18965 [Cyanobacteria bacterium UBA11049]|nr:hypothetical protein [Cyanobacteria bacterium UBA11049]